MKNPLLFNQQLDKLQNHGIIVSDQKLTLKCLSDVNYYRLRGYWLSFEHSEKIDEGTSFDDIWQVYLFDNKIRNLLFKYIQPIEIKLRTEIAYCLSLKYGASCLDKVELFKSLKRHDKMLSSLAREIKRASNREEKFVKHNLEKYGALPIWASVELMSFGNLSLLYENIKPELNSSTSANLTIKKEIASSFGLTPHYFTSGLRHLCYVRNTCAHQNRFYNNFISISPKLRKKDKEYADDRQFATFVILKYFYEKHWGEAWDALLIQLEQIIKEHPKVSLRPMGFPDNWLDVLSID